jgi:bla regulator protein BlaR1
MSPFTIGVVRPLIYLPQGVVDDSRCMEAAMAHEMAHVARFDALWLGLQNFLQAVYFFNPVVWIAGSRLNHAREQLCDATVVAADRLAARDYVGGLLYVLRLELRGLGAPTMTARKRRIGMRILNILEREGGPRPMGGLAALVSVVFGILLLPLGSGGASAPPAAVVVVQNAPELQHGQDVEFVNPLPDGRMTWSWGPGHRDPFTGMEVSHQGIDLAAPAGTPVASPADGVVRVATEAYEPSPGSGTVIIVEHAEGLVTFYAHLGVLEVIEGERVERGDVIATVGSTGRSTGPHLHFEVRRDGEAVDPAEFVAEWRK